MGAAGVGLRFEFNRLRQSRRWWHRGLLSLFLDQFRPGRVLYWEQSLEVLSGCV